MSDTVVSAPTLSSTSFAPCVSGVTAVTLYAASREYVSWTFQADGTVTAVDVFLDAAWRSATVDGTVATLLLAGSGATGNPEGTIVLAAGTYDTLVRFTEAPELPVRPGGRITVIG